MNTYGTEADKVNCSFYYKIGACRHGDRCSRKHTRPNFSPTVVLYNIYANPKNDALKLKNEQLQQHFDMFYTDMFIEMSKYGYIDELVICDNICDHLIGNVFCKYRFDEDAKKAQQALDNRYYAARPIYAELSPVVSFRDALCKQHDDGLCARGKMCNFMHLKRPTLQLLKELKDAQVIMYHEMGRRLEIKGRDINEMNFGNKAMGVDDRGRNDRGYYRDRDERPRQQYRNDRSRPEHRNDHNRNEHGAERGYMRRDVDRNHGRYDNRQGGRQDGWYDRPQNGGTNDRYERRDGQRYNDRPRYEPRNDDRRRAAPTDSHHELRRALPDREDNKRRRY
eukprot:NODE_29_length_33183_cov_0.333666.p6 type:complete len:337 gc:universal NODE_29_length_33183_cov_0.333666:22642-21632(-)